MDRKEMISHGQYDVYCPKFDRYRPFKRTVYEKFDGVNRRYYAYIYGEWSEVEQIWSHFADITRRRGDYK